MLCGRITYGCSNGANTSKTLYAAYVCDRKVCCFCVFGYNVCTYAVLPTYSHIVTSLGFLCLWLLRNASVLCPRKSILLLKAPDHRSICFATMTEQDAREIKLIEVLSQDVDSRLAADLAVYEYQGRDGKKKEGRKLQIILITKDASQYCIGVAKMTPRGGVQEVEELQKKWTVGTCWKLSMIVTDKAEKQSYISTSVKTAIELRKRESKMLLQSRQSARAASLL